MVFEHRYYAKRFVFDLSLEGAEYNEELNEKFEAHLNERSVKRRLKFHTFSHTPWWTSNSFGKHYETYFRRLLTEWGYISAVSEEPTVTENYYSHDIWVWNPEKDEAPESILFVAIRSPREDN